MTITLAIPSKGRLMEKSLEALKSAGVEVSAGETRSYRTQVEGFDGLEVLLLSASEIARELRDGAIDFGITGEDLVRETIPEPDNAAAIVARLGFNCNRLRRTDRFA